MRGLCSMRLPAVFALAFALLAVELSGCSHPLGPSGLAAEDSREIRVAIAPMNLAVELPLEFERAVEPVERELIDFFRARGARVAIVHRADAWALWRDVIATIRQNRDATLDFETAVRQFVLSLTEHDDFDVLVLPSLVFREARASGRYVRWDGVRRRIHFYDRSAAKGAEPDESEWRSRLAALSLHALVYTRDGERAFEGWGGLDVVHDPVVSRGAVANRPSLRLRRELLENPEFVREGVVQALEPFSLPTRSPRSQRLARGGRAGHGSAGSVSPPPTPTPTAPD